MSDSTNNIASPTPDQPDYGGKMTAEEYAQQPESNTGATVERDIDEPNPKPAPENDPNVPDGDTEKQHQFETEAAMQSTANQVERRQNRKLSGNTKPGTDPDKDE